MRCAPRSARIGRERDRIGRSWISEADPALAGAVTAVAIHATGLRRGTADAARGRISEEPWATVTVAAVTIGAALHKGVEATILLRARSIDPRATTTPGIGVEVAALLVAVAEEGCGHAGSAGIAGAVVGARTVIVGAALAADSVLGAVMWRAGRARTVPLGIARQSVLAAHPLAADVRRVTTLAGRIVGAGSDPALTIEAGRALANAVRGTCGTSTPVAATGGA
jgi:hypothetical protein